MPAAGQTIVHFPSGAPGRHVQLDAYLYQPSSGGKHPAAVFLHGCGGLLNKGVPESRARQWASVLNERGYVVLMVDSFTPRGVRNMCAPSSFDERVYMARPYDAFAALAYLQQQSFVDPSRIALFGWSEGGGTVLFTVGGDALSVASGYRAAVAFYPASCRATMLGDEWQTRIPLLVLIGGSDVWTRAGPCAAAIGQKPNVEMKIYPGAYHDFDWPNDRVHAMPAYRTSGGVVPIAGEDPAAHDDAIRRVVDFLEKNLGS